MDTESMDNSFLPAEECPSLKSSYNRDKSGGVKLRSIQVSQLWLAGSLVLWVPH